VNLAVYVLVAQTVSQTWSWSDSCLAREQCLTATVVDLFRWLTSMYLLRPQVLAFPVHYSLWFDHSSTLHCCTLYLSTV